MADFAASIEHAAVACLNEMNKWLGHDHGFSAAGNLLRDQIHRGHVEHTREGKIGQLAMRPLREAIELECMSFLCAPVVHNYLKREWVGGAELPTMRWYATASNERREACLRTPHRATAPTTMRSPARRACAGASHCAGCCSSRSCCRSMCCCFSYLQPCQVLRPASLNGCAMSPSRPAGKSTRLRLPDIRDGCGT